MFVGSGFPLSAQKVFDSLFGGGPYNWWEENRKWIQKCLVFLQNLFNN